MTSTDPGASPPAADQGSATIWLLGGLMVLILAGSTALSLLQVDAARQRAATAADLAALAAAADRSAAADLACQRARDTAHANIARMTACEIDSTGVTVAVEADLPGPLHAFGPARARARAGPWEGAPNAYTAAAPTRVGAGRPEGQLVRAPVVDAEVPAGSPLPGVSPPVGPSVGRDSCFLRRRSATRATTRSARGVEGFGSAGRGEAPPARPAAGADWAAGTTGPGAVAATAGPACCAGEPVTAAAGRASRGLAGPVARGLTASAASGPGRPIDSGSVGTVAEPAARPAGTEAGGGGVAAWDAAPARGAVPGTGMPAGASAVRARLGAGAGRGFVPACPVRAGAAPIEAGTGLGAGRAGAGCGAGTARVIAARSRARWRSSLRRCRSRAKPCSPICTPATTRTPVARPSTNKPQMSKDSDCPMIMTSVWPEFSSTRSAVRTPASSNRTTPTVTTGTSRFLP
ncbi:Rv3654c family TadE-like protein [Parafrankia sp. FMc2]|uniref:Rv3654c family TadE-like protein n=1 Tax=Parafrankia sp. FMc2 TaxID=3233196 RepID=UPI0034D79CAB